VAPCFLRQEIIDNERAKKMWKRPHGISTLDNKPIIITFLAMEKVILLCTSKTKDE
jgi:hypothetical protein